METPLPGPMQSNYPRQNAADDPVVLREVALSQKQVLYCVLAQLGLGIFNGVARAGHIPGLGIVVGLLALALLVYMVVSVVRLCKSLGLSPVIYAILMFIPCVSLVFLVILSQKATSRLQKAGLKVGLMGADPNAI
jgi:hypothetical protein